MLLCLQIKSDMDAVPDFLKAPHDAIMNMHNKASTMKDLLDKAQQDFIKSKNEIFAAET